MTRPRRNHLAALGRPSGRGGALTLHRCSDDGGAVPSRGGPRVTRIFAEGVRANGVHAFSAVEDWGWPPSEPASLSWPDDVDETANELARAAAFGAALTPAPTPPPPVAAPPAKPIPLAEAEADDDVAAILRDKGLTPIPVAAAPGSPTAVATTPAEPTEPAPPPEDRHAIFGQLGRAMPHANSFQLGRINIDQHFDMLEQGLAYHPPAPVPAAGARDIQELDVLSEITALSEAAGVRPAPADDGAAFLRKVARAQGVSLAGLERAQEEDAGPFAAADDEADADTGADDDAADDDAHSPFPDTVDDGSDEPEETDDG